MVKALHKAGIEVILDVVFNHTGEGNQQGPTISFRGSTTDVYYHLVPSDRQYYMNYSGCGNTVNCNHPIGREVHRRVPASTGCARCTWTASASTRARSSSRGEDGIAAGATRR